MPFLSAIIIDDEPDACDLLSGMLADTGIFQRIVFFTDALKGLDAVLNHPPDVFFLDIEMPGLSGIDIIQQIKPWLTQSEVVFVTAHPKYSLEAAKNNVFDYLLKPVETDDVKQLAQKLTETFQRRSTQPLSISGTNRLVIWSTNGIRIIRFEEVFYLEADKNYTEIRLASGEALLTSQSLGAVEKKLPGKLFLRISRKHIINSDYLISLNFKEKTCCLKSQKTRVNLHYTRKIREFIKDWHET